MLTTSEVGTNFGAAKLALLSFPTFLLAAAVFICGSELSLRREFLVLLKLYFSRVSFDAVHLCGGNGQRDNDLNLIINMCMVITVH